MRIVAFTPMAGEALPLRLPLRCVVEMRLHRHDALAITAQSSPSPLHRRRPSRRALASGFSVLFGDCRPFPRCAMSGVPPKGVWLKGNGRLSAGTLSDNPKFMCVASNSPLVFWSSVKDARRRSNCISRKSLAS
eukprot:GEMP01031243.1.p1 GENE.GEMP01031243.1~~GEMP01031243.1.p1  ORF type:complete len:134 (-),score=24.81 GEMP01031243.1:623-1024(-)